MNRLNLLVRDPALVIDAVETAIVLAVSLGLFSLTGEAQRDLIALVIVILAAVKGITTKPFPVTVIPDLGRAALVFFGSVGITHLSADQITLVATFLGTVMTLVSRSQITPVNSPVVAPLGAGAGPVTTEAGYASPVASIGVLMALIGVLLIVLTAYYTIGLILVVVGVVVILVSFTGAGGGTYRT